MHEWQKKYNTLRSQFMDRSQERLETLRVLIEHMPGRPDDLNLLREARHLFHWCAGSGGVYGFEQVTRFGLQGEELCDRLLFEKQAISKENVDKMLLLVASIYNAIENDEVPAQDQQAESIPPAFEAAKKEKALLLFVENNQASLHKFTRELEEHGVQIQTALSCSSAREIIMKRLPDSLVISLPLPDGNGYELASLVRSCPGGERPPIIFLSQQAGFLDKVAAIRSGADGFFEHPFDENEILRKIEHLLERDQPEKYKILSVEDDPDQAEFIKLTLDSAGYNVTSLQDPSKFEETFLKTEPDLVLLDVMLGSISGFELAQYIRQNDRYAALPVVFLTTENALDMHIRSARIGGDDHLIKPIAPQLLAAAVSGRLEKARTLKRLIDRDGLSGCLNFGAFMEKAGELAKPDSHRFSLTLLLIDIDSMHIVNDRFGYAVGDKVIGTLGRLLSKSLRNASLIGRIAGDRFAVILENLDDLQVERISTQIVQEFAQIQQFAPGGAFRSTLSVSFASYNNKMDLRAWIGAAEKTLAAAKENGGNQIKSYSSPNSDWSGSRR
ncbi:MAG: response regulator [Candidatus Obscuribacterales bacterium]|nr:response regulator [Candidatus Obscuribacterales bacterium]